LDQGGVMTDRIGHDLNNLLSVIQGNASLVRLDLPPDSPGLASLDQIDEAVRRAVLLAAQIVDPPRASRPPSGE
jgi:signal transduction histidine kinase